MWQGPEGDPQEFRAISSEQLAKKKKKFLDHTASKNYILPTTL